MLGENLATSGALKVWPFDPAWPPGGESVQETYTFQTEVITSRSGRESRLAHLVTPRKEVQQTVFLAGDKLRRYKDLMWAWQHRDVVLADIFREIALPAAMLAGDSTLDLAGPPEWLVPDAAVVLGHGEHQELLIVASVVGGVVTFLDPVSQDWPAGARMTPGLIGNLALQIDADRMTNEVAQGSLRFAVRPLYEVPRVPAAPELTFDGREVFTLRPNWAQGVSSALSHEVDILDYGTGPISRYAAVNFGREITGATYLGTNRERVNTLFDLFLRMHGQQGEFWMPTWEPDFALRSGATTGGTSLRVQGDGVVESYTGSSTHQAVFVKLNDGTLLLNTVASLAVIDDVDGRDSLLTLVDGWSQGFAPGDVVMAGWLLLRRFATDTLAIEWLTDRVANVQVNLMTLEALPEETAPV